VIAITTGPSGQGAPSVPAVIVVEATVFAASLLVVIATVKRSGPLAENGLALGLAAGALFGVCDVAMKFVTHALAGGVLAGVVSPWPLVAVAASVIAFYVSARSLQIGPALGVIAFASVAANLVAISGGILVFHDSMGAGSAQIAARMLAFCLVIFGSALIPGPVRAHTTGDPGRYGLLRPAPSPHGAA
jgi:hypothetical protein